MSTLSFLATPAFAGSLRSGGQAGLDQLEQAVADTLARLKPGRRSAGAVHEQLQHLVLANAVLMELSPQVAPAAVAAAVKRLRRSHVIDAALERTTQAHVQALSQAGLDASVLELLRSWVEVTVDARVLQRQIDLRRAIASVQGDVPRPDPAPPEADPVRPLSAAELGQALGGLGDETVRQRERAGELFSILRPGRKRGREYPAFQAWSGIAGDPLVRVLAALDGVSATVVYGFFTSPTDLLGGLTPIEALLGRPTSNRDLAPQAREWLATAPEDRLAAVVEAARACAALQAA